MNECQRSNGWFMKCAREIDDQRILRGIHRFYVRRALRRSENVPPNPFSLSLSLFFFNENMLNGHIHTYIKLSHRPVNSISILHARITDASINIHSTTRMTLKYRFEQYTQRRVLIVGECSGQFPEIMSVGDPIFCTLTQRVFYREKLR